jgi:hypothetical protein
MAIELSLTRATSMWCGGDGAESSKLKANSNLHAAMPYVSHTTQRWLLEDILARFQRSGWKRGTMKSVGGSWFPILHWTSSDDWRIENLRAKSKTQWQHSYRQRLPLHRALHVSGLCWQGDSIGRGVQIDSRIGYDIFSVLSSEVTIIMRYHAKWLRP